MTDYASIVPLIGGETIAMQNVLGKRPEYILSYDVFQANDKHLLEYYNNEVPYHLIEDGKHPPVKSVDIVNTVCPCAGLSSLSPSSSTTSETNDWLYTTARHVLEHIQPKVLWGENAPRLASKMGEPIVKTLKAIGQEFGYVFSIYKTKSLHHGLSQVRDRTFYFFWKGDKVPLFDYHHRPHKPIEDAIREIEYDPNDSMSVLGNDAKPTENPYYQYVLQKLDMSHVEFGSHITKTTNPLEWIHMNDSLLNAATWMDTKGFDKEADKCRRKHAKLASGGNIMWHNIEIPKDRIGAFVGHRPTSLAHPDEDRFLTIRESLSLMGLPKDFILQGGRKNLNHICQNVPVATAMDMAQEAISFCEGRKDNQLIETTFLMQNNKDQSYWNEKMTSVQLDQFMI